MDSTNLICDCCGEQIGYGSESCGQTFDHPDGYSLPLDFTQDIHIQMEMRLPVMESNVLYTLKEICGKAYWKTLTKKGRQMAFSCVMYLIEYEDLLLEFYGINGEGDALFLLN